MKIEFNGRKLTAYTVKNNMTPQYVNWNHHEETMGITDEHNESFEQEYFVYNGQEYKSPRVYFKWQDNWFVVEDDEMNSIIKDTEYGIKSHDFSLKITKPHKFIKSKRYFKDLINPQRLVSTDSGRFENETKDCTVRALKEATGISYKRAHTILKEVVGRKQNRGVYFNTFMERNNYTLGEYKFKDVTPNRRITVGTFMRENPKGNFILITRGHAQAVVNGVLKDIGHGLRGIVIDAYEYQK